MPSQPYKGLGSRFSSLRFYHAIVLSCTLVVRYCHNRLQTNIFSNLMWRSAGGPVATAFRKWINIGNVYFASVRQKQYYWSILLLVRYNCLKWSHHNFRFGVCDLLCVDHDIKSIQASTVKLSFLISTKVFAWPRFAIQLGACWCCLLCVQLNKQCCETHDTVMIQKKWYMPHIIICFQ